MKTFRPSWFDEAQATVKLSNSVALTMFAQTAISIIETLIVTKLGEFGLAGMSVAISLYIITFLFTLGFVEAATPFIADAYGRGDAVDTRVCGHQAFWIALTTSVPGGLLLFVAGAYLNRTAVPGSQLLSTGAYLVGAAWGLPAWVCYVAVRCIGVATSNANITTILMIASIPAHAVITWWLVFGGLGVPPLGVYGAGLSYSITAFLALIILSATSYLLPKSLFKETLRLPLVFDWPTYKSILSLGLPLATRIVLRKGVLSIAVFAVIPFGAAMVSAHAIASRTVDLANVYSFGIGNAANVRVSYAGGSNRPDLARIPGWVSIQVALIVNITIAFLVAVNPYSIAYRIFHLDALTTLISVQLLPIAACVIFLEGLQAAVSGALSGLRDAKVPLLISLAGSWLIGLPMGVALSRLVEPPVVGLWMGLTVGSSFTTLLYLLRFNGKTAA